MTPLWIRKEGSKVFYWFIQDHAGNTAKYYLVPSILSYKFRDYLAHPRSIFHSVIQFFFLCTCDIEIEFESSCWLFFLIELNIYPGLYDYQIYFPPETVSDQIRSVTHSCLTLCDPMNLSTPGLPVHHQLPEFTQTHVHWVSDAIQPSHPLSSPSPPAPNPSQQQSLFQWVNSSHEVAKVLEFQL